MRPEWLDNRRLDTIIIIIIIIIIKIITNIIQFQLNMATTAFETISEVLDFRKVIRLLRSLLSKKVYMSKTIAHQVFFSIQE